MCHILAIESILSHRGICCKDQTIHDSYLISFKAHQLRMLIIVDVNVDEVSIAFAFAWKFRCAVIRSTSSDVRSTFALSLAPARIVPKPAPPGSPSVGAPDSLDSKKVESPSCRSPLGVEKVDSTILPFRSCVPFEYDAVTKPSSAISTATKDPFGWPF